MRSNATGIALGLLGAYVALLIFPPLFETIAGWQRVLEHFEPPSAPAGARLGYASLGRFLTIPVRLCASSQGLHITGGYFPPWRTKRSVCVPWLNVSQRGTGSLFLGTCFVVAAAPEVFIRANWFVARRLRRHLVGANAA